MQIKYAIFNAETGLHEYFDTEDAAREAFWESLVYYAIKYNQSMTYATVIVNDDGSEVWKNEQGQELNRPTNHQDRMEAIRKARLKIAQQNAMIDPKKLTQVQVLP